jgi:hypothetical protein
MRVARQFRQTVRGILLVGFLFGSLLQATTTNGTFLLMSREGGGEWQQSTPQWQPLPPLLHIAPLVDTAWRTADEQSLLLGLSNRSVLILAPASAFRVSQFSQDPFIDTTPQPSVEPSASSLQIRLESGRLLIQSGELRSNSSVIIRGNHGELRIGSGTALMETTAGATRIWLLDGSARFSPTEGERIFLSAGTSYHQHSDRAPLRFNFTEAELEEDIRHLQQAAMRGFNRLAIVSPAEEGLSRAERRHPNLPRPRIVQPTP